MNESLLSHPKIVIHFGEILVAGIGHECDDAFWSCLLPTITQRSCEKRASGGPAKNSFFAQKLTRRGKTFFVIDLKCFCDKRHIGNFGDEIFTDAFYCPAARFSE